MILVALAGLGGLCSASAQTGALRAGDRAYEALAYQKAIAHYERAARQGAPDSAFASELAHSYYAVRDLEHAEYWFARAVGSSNAHAEDRYLYAQTLRATGRYADADQWLKRYQENKDTDSRTYRQAHAERKMRALLEGRTVGCDIRNLNTNTAGADMGTAYANGSLVFASDRTPGVMEQRRHAWNGRSFLDLYYGLVGLDGGLTDVKQLEGVNTKYHDAVATFSPDGTAMYFTRNNYHLGRKGRNARGEHDLKIYRCQLVNGHWTNETPFVHNGDHSSGHPALSPDGHTLYFVSDRPGGVGGADIWRCTWDGKEWGAPVNMGSTVNTEGDELFPFVAANGDLFFASDGHMGLGGLDIFLCAVNGEQVSAPMNPGAPLNSDHDDFALVVDPSRLKGYFTSDRPGGRGNDDLYAFTLQRPLGPQMYVKGRVMDLHGTALSGTTVELLDEQGHVLHSGAGSADGSYAFELEPDRSYRVAAVAEGYRRMSDVLMSGPPQDTTVMRDLRLPPFVKLTLWPHVVNAKTGEGVPDAVVQVMDDGRSGAPLISGRTNEVGDLRQVLEDRSVGDTIRLQAIVTKEGFFPLQGSLHYVVRGEGVVALHEAMDLRLKPMEVGTDIGKVIDLKPIHFDVGKADIRPDAAAELDKVVAMLNEFPSMRIELGSHTDSRGSKTANQALSAKRAKSSVAYIVGKGVAKDRIKAKGYGESKPLNRCTDRVPCSEEEYQQNRRTEFIITRM